MLADAQAAEARGDKSEAISLLKRAAEVYRDSKNSARALKLLRHIRRLEGLEELEVLDGGDEPEPGRRRPKRVIEERGPGLADPALDAWCSFCCRPKAEAGALVGGPTGSFICASCLGAAQGFLGATPAPKAKTALLPHQQAAVERLGRAKLGLLLGPAGSGKTTVLAALGGLTIEAPVEVVPDGERVVVAVQAAPPAVPLTVKGQPVYDTATLVTACAGQVPDDVLARVDAVVVLPAFDAASLTALAAQLGVTEAAELVQLALKSPSPARELCALIRRLG